MVAPVDSGVSTVMTGTGTLAGNLEVKVWRIVLDLDLPRRRPFRKNFENNPESLLWPFPDPWSRSTSERLTSVVLLELALWCTFHVTLRNLDEEAGVGRSLGGKTVIFGGVQDNWGRGVWLRDESIGLERAGIWHSFVSLKSTF